MKGNSVFVNNSNQPLETVDLQLAVVLYQVVHFRNAASVKSVARIFGIGEGTVIDYTARMFQAINNLYDSFVCPLTEEEKEDEKELVRSLTGMEGGLWPEAWLMYDGTIVVLHWQPGHQGNGYYMRKSNYGLTVQVSTYYTSAIFSCNPDHNLL